MKRILLLLTLLLASPAFADDAVTSFGWNSVTGTFQAMTRALGWKQIPDYDSGTITLNFSGARSTSDSVFYVRIGKTVTVYFPTDNGGSCTVSTSFNASIPASITPPVSNPSSLSVPIYNSGAWQTTPGQVVASHTGSLVIGKDNATGNFTTGALCGWSAFVFTYTLN